jgi:hypothetical protein
MERKRDTHTDKKRGRVSNKEILNEEKKKKR